MPVEPFKIENNGKEIEVIQQKIKKGPNAGAVVNRPDFSSYKPEEIIGFFGADLLFKAAIVPTLNRIALGINSELADKYGDDPDKFIAEYTKKFKSLDSSGETLSNLKDQRQDLFDQMSSLDPKYDMTNGVVTFGTDPDTQKYVRLILEVKTLNETIDEKETEAEKRKAEKAAKAEKAEAVAA